MYFCTSFKYSIFAKKKYMKRNLFVALAVFVLSCTSTYSHNHKDTLGIGESFVFVQNKGQWHSNVEFRSSARDLVLWMEKDGYIVHLQDPRNPTRKVLSGGNSKYRSHAYKVNFVGSSSAVNIVPQLPRQDYENYYYGNDPSKWASKCGIYEKLSYVNLYKNVDMNVYSSSKGIKYDLILKPGADLSKVKFFYEGVDDVVLKRNNNIEIHTSISTVVELKPYAYQTINGKDEEVECFYVLKNDTLSFALGKGYNPSYPMVIDPELIFSTYTGSTADNWGTTATFDKNRNTYSSGVVFGQGYPTSLGAMDTSYSANCDLGIIKLSSDGTTRMYATYMGGSQGDMPHSMYVNEFDELVIMGTTGSSDFPTTPGAYDTSFSGGTIINYLSINGYDATIPYPHGSDIFVSRFSEDGTRLDASTFIGGTGNDGLNYKYHFSNNNMNIIFGGNDSLYLNYGDGARGELITDDRNNIYVGTCTFSSDFPLVMPFQPNYGGGQDGVVFKLDYNLQNLLWSSYIGGSGDDAVYSIDTDKDYNLLVTGGSNSSNFPVTPNVVQPFNLGGGADCFISKISYDGSTLMSSTMYGSYANDQSYFVRVGKHNDVFIFGLTTADGNIMIRNALYNVPSSGQLLARFTPNLDTLVWSTVFGTGLRRANISPTAFAIDVCDRIYLAGWGRDFCGYRINNVVIPWNTYGTTGMQTSLNAIQSNTDGQDFYIACISGDASALEYATFFGELHLSNSDAGGDHVDGGTSRFDKLGTLYQSVCASCGGAQNFPTTPDSWDTVNRARNCNNGIFKMNINNDFPVADFINRGNGCAPDTVAFTNTGRGESFLWSFGDSTYSTEISPSHVYNSSGIYTVTLVAYMEGGCTETDTISKTIVVLGDTTYSLDTIYTCAGVPVQIGIQPMMGYTYRWITSGVSDNTVANPYVTIDRTTTHILLINNGICVDTVFQTVDLLRFDLAITYDTNSCTNPIMFSVETSMTDVFYHWSSNSSFTDTLNTTVQIPDVYLYITEPSYYYVKIYNSEGCFTIDSIFVNLGLLTIDLEITDPQCPDSCNGSVIAHINNGNPPFSYTWTSLLYSTEITTADSVWDSLCNGFYNIEVADALGCTTQKIFTLVDPEPPLLGRNVVMPPCGEVCMGSISLTVSTNGGEYDESDFSFLWLDDSTTLSYRDSLCEGEYIVMIITPTNCVFYDTIILKSEEEISVSSTIKPACGDDCDGRIYTSVSGGTAPYTYNWSDGSTGATIVNLCEGVYVLDGTDAVGCHFTDTVEIFSVHTFDSVDVWADRYTIFKGESTTLHSTYIPNVTYVWSPTEGLENPSSYTTVASPEDTIVYYLTMVDEYGCKYTDTVKINCIEVICGLPNLFIPNSFSPNGDGVNDKLTFRGEWIRSFKISIFSRWGEKVFETSDINAYWDGMYKDKKCHSGVYMYVCEIVCEDNQESIVKGDITIIW